VSRRRRRKRRRKRGGTSAEEEEEERRNISEKNGRGEEKRMGLGPRGEVSE